MSCGVSAKALTPLMVIASSFTRICSRNAGSRFAASAAATSTCTFHSAAVFGKTFQFGLMGAPMIFCICRLTVSGTGIVRAGTSRGGGVWAAACCEDAIVRTMPAAPAVNAPIFMESSLIVLQHCKARQPTPKPACGDYAHVACGSKCEELALSICRPWRRLRDEYDIAQPLPGRLSDLLSQLGQPSEGP